MVQTDTRRQATQRWAGWGGKLVGLAAGWIVVPAAYPPEWHWGVWEAGRGGRRTLGRAAERKDQRRAGSGRRLRTWHKVEQTGTSLTNFGEHEQNNWGISGHSGASASCKAQTKPRTELTKINCQRAAPASWEGGRRNVGLHISPRRCAFVARSAAEILIKG